MKFLLFGFMLSLSAISNTKDKLHVVIIKDKNYKKMYEKFNRKQVLTVGVIIMCVICTGVYKCVWTKQNDNDMIGNHHNRVNVRTIDTKTDFVPKVAEISNTPQLIQEITKLSLQILTKYVEQYGMKGIRYYVSYVTISDKTKDNVQQFKEIFTEEVMNTMNPIFSTAFDKYLRTQTRNDLELKYERLYKAVNIQGNGNNILTRIYQYPTQDTMFKIYVMALFRALGKEQCDRVLQIKSKGINTLKSVDRFFAK